MTEEKEEAKRGLFENFLRDNAYFTEFTRWVGAYGKSSLESILSNVSESSLYNAFNWGAGSRESRRWWELLDIKWRAHYYEREEEVTTKIETLLPASLLNEEVPAVLAVYTAKQVLAMTLEELGCTINNKALVIPSKPHSRSITLSSLRIKLKAEGPPINEKFLALFILSEKRHPHVRQLRPVTQRDKRTITRLLSTHVDEAGKRVYGTTMGFCDQIIMVDECWSTFQEVVAAATPIAAQDQPAIFKRHGEPE